MSHLEAGTLHALLDGEIASSELPPVQAHLAECAECRARLEQERLLLAEAEGLVETLEVPAGEPATRAPERPRPRWGVPLAWAASLIAAVGLGYVARGGNSAGTEPPRESQLSGIRADSPVALPAAPAAGVAPAQNAPGPLAAREPAASGQTAKRNTRNRVTVEPPRQKSTPALERLEVAVSPASPAPDSSRRVAEPSAAPTVAGALGTRLSAQRLRGQSLRLEEAVVTGVSEASAAKAAFAPPEPISLSDAIRRLGGSLRLIEGLIPLRLEAQGPSVRVVYAVSQGELVLSQQLVDGRVEYTLIAPPGFPPDSLPRLKARVRD